MGVEGFSLGFGGVFPKYAYPEYFDHILTISRDGIRIQSGYG